MATRLYLPASADYAAPVTVTPDAAWNSTASPYAARGMKLTTDADDALTTTSAFSSTSGQNRAHRQFVSAPMAAGNSFTTSTTFKAYAQVLESAANDNIVARIGVRIVSRDGSTVRATLLTVGDKSTGAEWNTSIRNKAFADGDVSAANYTTVAGDRLVVEFGHNDSAGATISGQSRWGLGGSSDLGENETDTTTTTRPWFETSLTITWDTLTPVTYRAGDTISGESFSRSSSATYVGVNGLINTASSNVKRDAHYLTRLTRITNFLTQSNGFTTTPDWDTASVTVTAGADGDASRITVSSGSHRLLQNRDASEQGMQFTAGDTYTFSFYAKNNGGTAASYSVHDLTHGTDIVAPTSYFSQLNGSTYTRISVTFVIPSGCTSFNVYPVRDSGTGVDLYLKYAQLEEAATAGTYVPTTWYPTSDLTSGEVSGPYLFLEGPRTNIALASELFTAGAGVWATTNVTVTDAAGVAPDGTTTAQRCQNVSGAGNLRQTITSGFTGGDWLAFSFYAKNNGGVTASYSVFDNTHAADIVAQTTYLWQLDDTLWNRIVVTFQVPAGCTSLNVYILRDDNFTGADILAWGAQVENCGTAGSFAPFASSYIKTVGATVARSGDTYDVPFDIDPAALTMYADLVDYAMIQHPRGDPVVLQIGASGYVVPTSHLYSNGGSWVLDHMPHSTQTSSSTGGDADMDRVELRGVIGSTGTATIGAAINGGSESTSGPSTARGLSTAWSAARLKIGYAVSGSATEQAFMALRRFAVVAGSQSMDDMRALFPNRIPMSSLEARRRAALF